MLAGMRSGPPFGVAPNRFNWTALSATTVPSAGSIRKDTMVRAMPCHQRSERELVVSRIAPRLRIASPPRVQGRVGQHHVPLAALLLPRTAHACENILQ